MGQEAVSSFVRNVCELKTMMGCSVEEVCAPMEKSMVWRV